jgi:predicted nucleotidyltransferase
LKLHPTQDRYQFDDFAVLKSLLLLWPCRTISAMDSTVAKELEDLPKVSGVAVTTFVNAARQVFRDDLRSVILYGSGAEGRLRPTSDINLVSVLSSFDPAKATAIRSQFSYAESAGRLTAMFLLESEIASAVELFAQKFADILRRHRVLYGPNPFAGLSIPRSAEIWRLKQVLLNLTLRLREAYVEYGSTPERISRLIADSAGPIRSCAATLSELEGKVPIPPKQALADFAGSLGDGGWEEVLAHISETRERALLSPDVSDATVFRLIELATQLRTRAEALR